MGLALMKGAASVLSPKEIGFSDADSAKAQAAAASIGAGVFASNIEALQKGDYVFLAVKPQILKGLLEEISPALKERLSAEGSNRRPPVLVSMAAGWSIEKLQACLGLKAPVLRIMPNTPSLVSRGVIVMACSLEVSAECSGELEKILSGAGLVVRMEERFMDAVTGLSGSGPAFAYVFIEALADGGVRAGLPRDKALQFAAQTVLGSATMVLETGKHPGELKDMVSSPGGTTIAGLAALENSAFRAAAINAVEAAWRRAVEISSSN
jgi:pyrroline-5-carboxylate reductase